MSVPNCDTLLNDSLGDNPVGAKSVTVSMTAKEMSESVSFHSQKPKSEQCNLPLLHTAPALIKKVIKR